MTFCNHWIVSKKAEQQARAQSRQEDQQRQLATQQALALQEVQTPKNDLLAEETRRSYGDSKRGSPSHFQTRGISDRPINCRHPIFRPAIHIPAPPDWPWRASFAPY